MKGMAPANVETVNERVGEDALFSNQECLKAMSLLYSNVQVK